MALKNLAIYIGREKCDHIGLFLKNVGYKSSPNVSNLLCYFKNGYFKVKLLWLLFTLRS